MKFYEDLYCKNNSLHGATIVTIVDQYERPIFHGTFDEFDIDHLGDENPVKCAVARWAVLYATVWEYHIVSVSTNAPDDACAVPLTNGIYISELYVKVHDIDKLKDILRANGIGFENFLSYVGWHN